MSAFTISPDTGVFARGQWRIPSTTETDASFLDELSVWERRPISSYEPPGSAISRSYYSRGKQVIVSWAERRSTFPAWSDSVIKQVVDVLTLPPNWNSYGAPTIDRAAAQNAVNFLVTRMHASTPAPSIVPLSSGGIQLEWHRRGIDLEVVFELREPPFFSYQTENNEEGDCPVDADRELLSALLRRLE